MYTTCPKCHYKRQPGDKVSSDICPRCGLVFSKWIKAQYGRKGESDNAALKSGFATGRFTETLLVEEKITAMQFWGRALLFLGLFVWGWHFILLEMQSNAIGQSFMHNINLVFHEAGHVIFRLFGHFMTILGGSLMQILMPLIVLGVFLFKQHNPFAASVGLWWAGQSMMDVAPYINDARARQLPLIGGGDGRDRPWMHDWYNILGDLGWLRSDHTLASIVDTCGEVMLLLALAWGGYLLYRQFNFLYR